MGEIANAAFGQFIRRRRREFGLTQKQIARRIEVSTGHLGNLENGSRRPSVTIVARIAKIFGDGPTMFFSANPEKRELLRETQSKVTSSWESFRNNTLLRELHRITPQEMELLSSVSQMGEVRSERDFIYILNTVRQALGQGA
jgi:transcriptional regulator with XRE-family HTH domain